jgi:hypothetical protein
MEAGRGRRVHGGLHAAAAPCVGQPNTHIHLLLFVSAEKAAQICDRRQIFFSNH